MKTILVMRHAKSSWDESSLADQDRPLNKRGQRDAPRMGKLLRAEKLTPQAVFSSPARRARDTAFAVAQACKYNGQIELIPGFYGASLEVFWQALSGLPENVQRVMLIGHNPDVEEFVNTLTGETASMPTAAVAWIELPIQRWVDAKPGLTGKLLKVWRPKDLPENAD